MNFKKWISFLTAGTLAAGAVTVSTAVTETKADAADDSAYKIMCVGDSITHGYINGDNGYRKYLCHYLQQNDISYDMVGPENNWTDSTTYNWNGTSITYDPAHCGYSGYAIRQYSGRSGIYETLFGNGNQIDNYDPDMVLLQIGTNDLLDARLDKTSNGDSVTDSASALERLEFLVDEILGSLDSTDTLFLASVPDIDAEIRADWLGSYGYILGVDTSDTAALKAKVDSCVDTYNAGVKALVSEKKSAGYNVEFCDINSVVDVKAGLEDGVHPNEAGYAEMGLLWANTISSYLGENPVVTNPATTTTTTATTVSSSTSGTSTVSTTSATKTTTQSSITTTATTIQNSEGDVHLTDVVAGEVYDLSAYDGITAISVVFDAEDEYIGGKFVLGNWEVSKDYSAADFVNNTLTVAVDGEYDQMTIFKWNGTAGIKEVILHFADSTTTTESSASTTVTTTTTTTTESKTTTSTLTTTTEETKLTTTTTSAAETTTTIETTTTEATTTDVTDYSLTGDVNGDEQVSLLDVIYLRKYIAGSISKEGVILENCDMDKDGKVNIFDAVRLMMYIVDAL